MERHNYDKLEHSAKYSKLENLQEYRNQLIWAWQQTTFLEIPFYLVLIYKQSLITTVQLSLVMLYISRLAGQVQSIITFSTWYKKNMRSMNQFFEVLRLPVEEGYTTFEKDVQRFSMINGKKLQETLEIET